MVTIPTDTYVYSTRESPRPWPLALNGFWKPPFMPLFLVYGAASLYRAYTTARNRQFKLHRRWIIRLNALFLGVTLSRPVLVLLVGILVRSSRASEVPPGLLTLSVGRSSIARPRLSLETLLGCYLEEQSRVHRPSRNLACN